MGAAGGAAHLELMDWKRRMLALYADLRASGEAEDGDLAAAAERFRAGRDRLFAEHPQSPLAPEDRAGFPGVPWYPYEPAWRVTAALAPEEDGPARELPVSTGAPAVFRRVGHVHPVLAGARCRLAVFWLEGYGGGLFLPFQDATSGRATYGGGRYLLDTVKGADLGATGDGALVLDFNHAYNPSCSYDPRWSCPLSPPENRLAVAVDAGEHT